MEEKYLHDMYNEVFYRAAALASHEYDSAQAARSVASAGFQPYSQQRFDEGLFALNKKCQSLPNAAPAPKAAPPDAAAKRTWLSRRAARVLMAAALAGAFLLGGTVTADGGVFDRLTATDHGIYSAVSVDIGALQLRPEEWPDAGYPTWTPEGFQLVQTKTFRNGGTLLYKNEAGGTLYFDFLSAEYNTSPNLLYTINTEGCTPVQAYIHGNPATVYVNPDTGYTLCYFSYQGAGYLLGGNVTADEIVKMAEQLSVFAR